MLLVYRVYRLPSGQGFYIIFEDNRAFLFPEDMSYKEAAEESKYKTSDNCYDDFIEDFIQFGINGFGLYGANNVTTKDTI